MIFCFSEYKELCHGPERLLLCILKVIILVRKHTLEIYMMAKEAVH